MDFSQTVIANVMAYIGNNKPEEEFDEDLIRHMVLNTIRANQKKFRNEYGNMVICCDDTQIWRKETFPQYKANRKKERKASPHDWNKIFTTINTIRDEVRDNLPYKFIKVEHAEADDVIGTLCSTYGHYHAPRPPTKMEPILILSRDKDFVQFQKYINVRQYSPITKEYITTANPDRALKEHIIYGDRGDGIPNILTDDNCLVEGRRQKPISKAILEDWVNGKMPKDLPGYERNNRLINLEEIPKEIGEKVMFQFVNASNVPTKKQLLDYFIKHKLQTMTLQLGDF